MNNDHIVKINIHGKFIRVDEFDNENNCIRKTLYDNRVVKERLGCDLKFLTISGLYRKQFEKLYKDLPDKEMLINYKLLNIYYKGENTINDN